MRRPSALTHALPRLPSVCLSACLSACLPVASGASSRLVVLPRAAPVTSRASASPVHAVLVRATTQGRQTGPEAALLLISIAAFSRALPVVALNVAVTPLAKLHAWRHPLVRPWPSLPPSGLTSWFFFLPPLQVLVLCCYLSFALALGLARAATPARQPPSYLRLLPQTK